MRFTFMSLYVNWLVAIGGHFRINIIISTCLSDFQPELFTKAPSLDWMDWTENIGMAVCWFCSSFWHES